MPLAAGSSEATIGANIAEMIRSGHPPKQAEAIAFSNSRKDVEEFRLDDFNEADHPRGDDGKFGSGGGSSSPKLSAKQKSYISSYTGDDFYKTNAELRAGRDGGSSVKSIDEAIAKSTIPSGTKLYRGMDREAAKKFIGGRDIKAGMEISDKAFMSTSKSKENFGYGSFGGVQFEISVGEDQNGLDVASLTRNPSEQEVLLPRNTKLRVQSIVPPKKVGDPVIVRVETVASDGASRLDAGMTFSASPAKPQGGSVTRAAGIMFITPNGEVLFLKRGNGGDYPGFWCFPGGTTEDGETAEETAIRETIEELGFLPDGERVEWTRRIAARDAHVYEDNGLPNQIHTQEGPSLSGEPGPNETVDFTTFIQRVPATFEPKLNGEHTGWAWAAADAPPEPLHPGANIALARLTMNELDIARAVSVGDLTSPQKYENVWLFAIRITGTGKAYRSALKEHVWRDPSLYLNDEFLARCNGLTTIWVHPGKGLLNSEEFADRAIGSIFLPYIASDTDGVMSPDGQSVWGIAKIYDEDAAQEMRTKKISTSPGVKFTDPTVNSTITLEDGTKMLVEGDPGLWDHIAVVPLGVWDKSGPPTGVLNTTLNERADAMAESAEEKKAREEREDAARRDAGGNIDKVLAHLDSMSKRMDAMEEDRKADKRRDAQHRRDAEREPWMKADAEGCARDDAEEKVECDKYKADGMDEDEAMDKARKDRRDRMDKRRADAESEDEKKAKADAETKEREDKARRDAEEKETKERADALVKADAQVAGLAAIVANMPKSSSDADYVTMTDAQGTYDPAYQAFGQRAPVPYQGESLIPYRRRLARGLQQHSASWKGVDLAALPDTALAIAETQIRSDAVVASRNPADMPEDVLLPVTRTTESGHRVTEFRGRHTFIHGLKRPSMRATAFLTSNRGA